MSDKPKPQVVDAWATVYGDGRTSRSSLSHYRAFAEKHFRTVNDPGATLEPFVAVPRAEWERLQKIEGALRSMEQFARAQKPMSTEFGEILNEEFWNLLL